MESHVQHQAMQLLSREQYAAAEPHPELSTRGPATGLDKQLQLQADAAGAYGKEQHFHVWYALSDVAAPGRQAGQGAAAWQQVHTCGVPA